ncbi:hypothetical protein D3C73_1435560 [compost metagenome]
MPVARAICRWNWKSDATASLAWETLSFSASSAARISANCSGLRRCAARPADSTSRLMRNSRIASTSRRVTTVAGSMRKPLGLGVSSTKVPMP